MQALRSKVFEAARRKDAAAVKKGVYEDNVDASGGEIRKGAESFAKSTPVDPKETLLHIAAKHGDIDLVRWLDSHGMSAWSIYLHFAHFCSSQVPSLTNATEKT